MKNKFHLLLTFLFLGLTTSITAQVTIGTDNNTNNNRIPMECYFRYTYSQSIYHQNEINVAGDITSISWTYTGSSHNEEIVMYMGTTTENDFSSSGTWISPATLTEVYNGTVALSSGTITVTLATPFAYNNINNLVIAVDENSYGYGGSSDEFYCSNLDGTTRSNVYYSDSTDPDPANLPNSGATFKQYVPNIAMNIMPALPVELVAFEGNAKDNYNSINWSTASERNTESFTIERSLDGHNNWSKIGEIEAIGASSQTINYEFEDQKPLVQSYYRLLTTDLDGTSQTSEIISIERAINGFEMMTISPNPAKEQTLFTFQSTMNTTITLTLADNMGKVIWTRKEQVISGINQQMIDFNNAPKGVYILTLNDGREQIAYRLVKY